MQKITPFLWFDTQAEEAAQFYVSVFPNSKIGTISRYGEAGPGPKGSVMTISFELNGVRFTALNGGPHMHINGAVSFVVDCESQAEVDHYWDTLTDGGEPGQCAWLSQSTTKETAPLICMWGPPFRAVNRTPSSSKLMVMTLPFGPGPASP